MIDRRCSLPRGRNLGGSSSINFMVYSRGHPEDYDNWVALGNYGWSYEEVLPYFKKSENSMNLNGINRAYHGRDGLLGVESMSYKTKLVHLFVKGVKEIGYKEIDYNSNEIIGVSYVQGTTVNGKRGSTGTTFILPILDKKPNLHVMMNTKVIKILIDANSKIAYGVQYIKSDAPRRHKPMIALIKKEIILSAGTYKSPQILMLSGIGPKQHLESLDINVIMDLPVGETLYDHVAHIGPTFILNTTGSRNSLNDNPYTREQFQNGYGPLTIVGGIESVAFIKTDNSKLSANVPDIELIFFPFTSVSLIEKQNYGITDELYTDVYRPMENTENDLWHTIISLMHPESKGYLKLKSNDPFDDPSIYLNYLEKSIDAETLAEGRKITIDISKTPTMQKFGTRLYEPSMPQCTKYERESLNYRLCAVRVATTTTHHPIGTCKMGPKDDRTAVVTPELTVYGISNLRVADASIMPTLISGHTNAPTIMIGEKISDLIKRDWNQQ